jgi:hypothetical protein
MKTKFLVTFFILICLGSIFAQSTIQEYPTALTSNEIIGKIVARDVGDSRQTIHFYTFNGKQGDLFINLETNNLNADIDVFTVGELRPLTKIVVYASGEPTETGRVVFIRKDERLLLRIKGRTPNDDVGTYRIKFAGAFEAIAEYDVKIIDTPKVKSNEESVAKVNSAGTLLEPKPKPTPKQTIEKNEKDEAVQTPQNVSTTGKKVKPPKTPKQSKKNNDEEKSIVVNTEKKDELVKAETKKKDEETSESNAKTEKPENIKTQKPKQIERPKVKEKKEETSKVEEEQKEEDKKNETVANAEKEKEKEVKIEKSKKTKPEKEKKRVAKTLDDIKLIVFLKEGKKLEYKMSEVNNFAVNQGNLTIILNNGEVFRYSILDVEKITID